MSQPSKRTDRLLNAATLMAALSAVVVAIVAVSRLRWEKQGVPPALAAHGDSAVLSPSEWRALLAGGHRLGPATAPLTIVEFGDFECPVCGAFEKTLERVERTYPDRVAIIFRHWPLSYHRFAYPAARASECAADQGRFQTYHDLLYQRQDSLGLISFSEFARRAGVPDLAQFATCNSDPRPVATIEADIAMALRVGGPGTPTVIVNGVRLGGIPDSATLASRLDVAMIPRH